MAIEEDDFAFLRAQATALAARKRYKIDLRFRSMVQSVVGQTRKELGRINPDRAERDATELALQSCALLIETIFQNDAELNALRHQVDAFRKMAEDALRLSPIKERKPT